MADDFSAPNNGISPESGTGAMVAIPARPTQLAQPTWSMGPPAIPEILTAKPGPVELLHALRRRWMIAIGLGLLLGGLLTAMVWFFVPVRYEVVALVRVSAVRQSFFGVSAGRREADFETYKRTQAALLKSNFVLQATLRKPEIQRLQLIQENKDDQLNWLSGQIIVDFPGDAEIMRVAMRGERPKELATLVNAVKQAYMDEIVNNEREESMRQRDVLERSYRKNREEIRVRMDALYQLHKQYGTSSSQAAQLKRQMAIKDLEGTVTTRNTIQQQLGELEMKILLMKARTEKAGDMQLPDFVIDQQISNDPYVAQLKQRMRMLMEAIEEEEHRAANVDSPSVARYRQQVQRLEEAIDERRNELRPILLEMIAYNSTGNDPTMFLPLMETEREAILKNLEKINASIEEQTENVQKMEKYSAEIETRTAELEELQQVTQRMGSELKLWALELEGRPRIERIEDASVPSSNDAVRKYVGMAFAGCVGFGAVLFGIALLEFQSRRLNTEKEVRDGLGIRVIGHLPSLSGRSWRRIGEGGSHGSALHSLLSENVDSVRATLLHSNGNDPPRVVMVSSADMQEGKTTVASQLAASLARAGRRTLMIDGDVRNPAGHLVFGIPLNPGFCEVLRGETECDAAIFPTPAENLWLMPAGQLDAQAVQAISKESFVELIKRLKQQYDFIVVDAPPVLKVADPMIFGQSMDAAVLSVRTDISRIPQVHEACERLRGVGVRVLGAIVNGVNQKPIRRSIPNQL
jgi:capsular exopolysaccharide synthesis family protein